jgi:DNA (cytosine-5)-methyltransferase 1
MTKGNLLSLFCGCGGLDLGFEKAGYITGLAYDRRPDAVSSWNRNRKVSAARVMDIRGLTLEKLDSDNGGEFRPTGVVGGPPCQGFSIANRSGSKDDPRNDLAKVFFDLALQLNSRSLLDFIVMENVPTIQGQRGGEILQDLLLLLDKHGFDAKFRVLDAVNFGVPQRRKRLFLVATQKSSLSSSGWCPPEPLKSVITVRKAIGHFPEPNKFSRGCDPKLNPYHENHWCMVPKSTKFFDGTLVEGFTANRSFKTLWWDQPSYTASYGNREVHIHPNCTRRLSVFEAMTIQGFPREFVLNGSMSSQITQVSEAVPPPLAKAIAKSILASVNAQTPTGVA